MSIEWNNGIIWYNIILVGGLEHYFFSISWECHHHWRTPSCFRGVAQPPTRSAALRSRFRRGKPTKIIESFSQCLSPGLFHIFSSTVYLKRVSPNDWRFCSHSKAISIGFSPWFSPWDPGIPGGRRLSASGEQILNMAIHKNLKPLVNIQKTIENYHFLWVNQL